MKCSSIRYPRYPINFIARLLSLSLSPYTRLSLHQPLGLYDRSTSLTEVQINCVESGEPPWKTFQNLYFQDSVASVRFDQPCCPVSICCNRWEYIGEGRTLPKHVAGFRTKYRNCAEPLRGNSARLFNPEHVIEVAAGSLASV